MTDATTRQLDTVIFRTFRDGEVIALFPDIPADATGHDVQSYQHVGQHGAADYALVMGMTRPATFDQATPLRDELTERGYNLNIRQRRTRNQ